MFYLVLQLPFDVLWIWRSPSPTKDAAEELRQKEFAQFPGIEVWSEDQVQDSTHRKVYVPDK